MDTKKKVEKPTKSQRERLRRMMLSGAISKVRIQMVITGACFRIDPENVIEVPAELTEEQLVADLEREFERQGIKLSYLNQSFRTWKFIMDERGQKYEVVTWTPGREVKSEEVQAHFRDLGASGNAVLFTMWIMKRKPFGYYASIPEDKQLFHDGGHLYAPSFVRDGDSRGFRLRAVRDPWVGRWVFVAFRAIPE